MFSKTVLFFLLSAFAVNLGAIEIAFSPSRSVKANGDDIERFQSILRKRNMGMSDKSAKAAVEENRILADAYLKTYGIPDVVKKEMQILLEEQLRNLLIEKEKQSIDISDDILLSYYKDNKSEFYKPDVITFNIYSFDNYDEAHAFYVDNKENYENMQRYVSEHNISKDSQKMPLRKLHKELQVLVKDTNSSRYIVPPEYFYKKYIILDVVGIEPSKLMTFTEAKQKVRTRLLSKINRDTKAKLLKKYQKGGKQQ